MGKGPHPDGGARVDDELLVTVAGAEHRVRPGGVFTFGRAAACTVRLDPDDPAISRLAGAVELVGGVWLVANRSSSRPLAVVDRFGLRSVLAPAQRTSVDGRVRVIVDGARASHELVLHGREPVGTNAEPAVVATGAPTSAGGIRLTQQEKLAMVALFAGYLHEGERYDPHPRSYAAAAFRLGCDRSTLVKRVEHLRTRLTRAGVPNLTGPSALYGLAEHALSTGLIKKEDLSLLAG
jgi:hypothetical protein